MKLLSNTQKFELNIIGYEFPDSNDNDDANWLNVEIIAVDEENSWSAMGSYLRTFELVELKKWFSHIFDDKVFNKGISFTENELSFTFRNGRDIIVSLDYMFHPSGEKYDCKIDKEYMLRFPLEEIVIHNVMDSLIKDIEKYPEKIF